MRFPLALLAVLLVTVAAGMRQPRAEAVTAVRDGSPHLKTRCQGQAATISPDHRTDPDHLVVGPFVWERGARGVSAGTIRAVGGDKLFVRVRKGHVATIELSRRANRHASLFYDEGGGILTETRVADGKRVMTFRACRGKRRLREGEDPATLWIGFVLASRPTCLPIEVWIDDRPEPVRRRVPLGRRC